MNDDLDASPAKHSWRQVFIHFHDYTAAERIGTVHIGPEMAGAETAGEIASWFFMRKNPCWRLRFLPAHDTTEQDAVPLIHQRLDTLQTAGHIANWVENIYEPEAYVFGGPAGMGLAHHLFHNDSRQILAYLGKPSASTSTGRGDQRRELSVLLCNVLMRTAGQDWFEQGDVWARVADELRPDPPDTPSDRLNTLETNLRRLMTVDAGPDSPLVQESGPLAFLAEWVTTFAEAGQFAQRFPLVARPRPACTPLARRVADLCDRARDAERNIDTATASAVHNLAALLASDCGLPELARQWCHRQANAYLRACPLDAQAARHALEPLVNLARLHIRDGHGERAFDLIEALYTSVSTRTEATIDGVEVPAHLTNSEETHHEVRRWLWTVLLATGARALAIAGRWQEACTRLRNYKGIGRRMLDGRQVAVIANATSGNSKAALALLDETEPGEPWENAVTACLTIQCRGGVGTTNLDTLLNRYYALNAAAPGLAVFHIRLGLSFIDAIGTLDNPHAGQIAASLINRAIAAQDGYAARDVLAHGGVHDLLSSAQARELVDLVETCALDRGIFPEKLLADLTIALTHGEEAIIRAVTPSSPNTPTGAPRDQEVIVQPGRLPPVTSLYRTPGDSLLTEMLVIEVAAPQMHRVRQPDLYDVPLLRFGPTPSKRP